MVPLKKVKTLQIEIIIFIILFFIEELFFFYTTFFTDVYYDEKDGILLCILPIFTLILIFICGLLFRILSTIITFYLPLPFFFYLLGFFLPLPYLIHIFIFGNSLWYAIFIAALFSTVLVSIGYAMEKRKKIHSVVAFSSKFNTISSFLVIVSIIMLLLFGLLINPSYIDMNLHLIQLKYNPQEIENFDNYLDKYKANRELVLEWREKFKREFQKKK